MRIQISVGILILAEYPNSGYSEGLDSDPDRNFTDPKDPDT
ncbi:unnamed protein product, partial [Brassica oleracea]